MMDGVTRIHGRAVIRSGILAGALITLLYGCGGPSTDSEEELREWLGRGVAAAEGGERRVLAGMISPAYADARGHDKDDVENKLRAYFMRMSAIELVTSVEEITVIDDSAAEILITVGMAGKHDGTLGFSADAYKFSLELQKDGRDWELISARWGQLGKELR